MSSYKELQKMVRTQKAPVDSAEPPKQNTVSTSYMKDLLNRQEGPDPNVKRYDSAVARELPGVAKKFEDDHTAYIASDEHKQKLTEQEKKQNQDRFAQQLLFGNIDIFQPTVVEDEKEVQLRTVAQQKRDYAVAYQDMTEIQNMTDAERRELEQFATGVDVDYFDTLNFAQNGVQIGRAEEKASNLIQKYGEKRLNELANTFRRQQNEQTAAEIAQKGQDAVTGEFINGAWESTKTVPVSAISGTMGTLGFLRELSRGDDRYSSLDPNTIGNMGSVYSSAVRGQVQQNIEGEDPTLLRKVASIGYQGIMSAADNIARAYLGGGAFGGAALAATNSFSQTMADASKQGATPGQAALLATTTAAIEALSEKIPLDNLIRTAKGGKQTLWVILKNALAQAGIEATTEEISLVGSLVAEAAILREKSDYEQTALQLILQGKSPAEARQAAAMGVLNEALNTALVSMVSGGVSSAGAGAMANIRAKAQDTAQIQTSEDIKRQALEKAQELDDAQQAEQPAQPEAENQPEHTQEAAQQPQNEPQQTNEATGEQLTQRMSEPEPAAPLTEKHQQMEDGIAATLKEVLDKASGTENGVSNSMAQAVLNDPAALEQLTQRTGMEVVGTKAEQRKAVKEALNEMFRSEQSKTADPQIQRSSPNANKQNPSPEGTQIKGTGAAEQNFSGKAEYQNLLSDDNVQRDRPGDVRPMEVPKVDGYGRHISEFVGNLYGAKITPDKIANEIESLVQAGALSYDRKSNQQALDQAAEAIARNGEDETREAIWKSVEGGSIHDGDIEKALLLYIKDANDPEGQHRASSMIVNLQEMATRSGRNLQLFKLLRRMTPEGQLMAVQKKIDRCIEGINRSRTKKDKVGAGQNVETDKAVSGAISSAKEETTEKIKDVGSTVRYGNGKVTVEGNQAGEPFVFEYAQKVGEALAKGLQNSQKPKPQKTFLQTITGELRKFASEKMPPQGQKSKPMTATELLRDYIQNQEFYAQAWEAAQETLRSTHANDPAFQEFINSGIGVDANANPRNKILAKALAAAAMETGETASVLQKQQALGVTNMAETIVQKLIQETGATGEMAQTIRDAAKDYVAGKLTEIDNGKQSKTDPVESSIRSAMRDIGVTLSDVARSSAEDRETAKQSIVDILTGKYGFGAADASHVADVVGAQFSKMAEAQAKKILEQRFAERKKPEKKTAAQLMTEYSNLGAFDIGSQYNAQASSKVLGGDYGIGIDEELAEAYKNAKSDEAKEVILDAIYVEAAGRIPSTMEDKWNAWRYMAMLGNVKTQARNFGGNAAFIPYKTVKDKLAAIFEKALPKDQRTKALVADEDLVKWAKSDAQSDVVRNALKYSANLGDDVTTDKIRENMRVFDTKALEATRKIVEQVQQRGDMLFKNRHYERSLAGFLKARGYTASDVQSGKVSEGVLAEARSYAIQEAMKATFNDCNAFSDFMATKFLRHKGDDPISKAMNIAGDAILPFRRTPANVVVRLTEYSPVGIAKGVWNMANKVRNGELSAATAIDQISAGLTGSAAMVFGYILANGIMGVKITGSGTDEDEKRQGHQDYALEFSIDGQEYSYKIDWAAPANLPLFVGANINHLMAEAGAETDVSWLTSCLYGTATMFEPLLALSCMSSLNDLVEGARYAGEGEALYTMAAKAATSYLTQGIPALTRQASQALSENKQTTFANSADPIIRGFQRTAANIPFAGSEFQTDKVNAWGEKEETGNFIVRTINAFLNPGTGKKIDNSPLEQEITRLNESGQNVTPDTASKTISYTDRTGSTHSNVRLTEEQYQTLATTQGQTSKTILEEMLKSKEYAAMTDAQKAEAINTAYLYARKTGEIAAIGKDNHTGYDQAWMVGIQGKEASAILRRVTNSGLSGALSNLNTAWDKGYNVERFDQELQTFYSTYEKATPAMKKQVYAEADGAAKRYIEARDKGISHKDFVSTMESVAKVKGTGAKGAVTDIDRRTAIANTTGLTEREIDIVMKCYMADYDPNDASPDKTELKYDYVRQELGLSPAEYAKTYRAHLDNSKKKERIAAIMALGYDEKTATSLYNVYAGTTSKIDVVKWYNSQ